MSRESPPAALDDRLDALAARVRRQRLLFGSSFTILIAILAALVIARLDADGSLSPASRSVLGVAWLLCVAAYAWRFVIRPRLADPPVEEVAERMMADDSPNVVAAIAREERERRHYPAWPSQVAATAALLGAVVAIGLAFQSGERVRRLVLPWHTRIVASRFEIVVVSGNAVARRGEPVTLSAYLRPRDPNQTLPQSATLRTHGGEWPMSGANGAFHATLPATDADFEYRVEVDAEASEWFTVRIADPVELAAESSIVVIPPAYLAEHVKPVAAPFADLEAVQFSAATITMRFTRPAESASLEWRPDGRNPFESADVIPVSLASDRRSGTATAPLRANGMLRAVLVNETGPRRLQTETAIGVRVKADQPPRFERLEGMASRPRTARPGSQLRVLFTVTDDFGIASATLESESGAAPILLERTGPARADGLAVIPVPSKDGDAVRFRLRIRDTRRIPAEALNAHELVFPPTGWFEVKAASTGPPFHEQQIAGQRNAVDAVLAEAKARFAAWGAELDAIKSEIKPREASPLDHTLRLAAIRDQLREVRVALERCAAESRLTPDLAPLADRLMAFASGPLLDADESTREAYEAQDTRERVVARASQHFVHARGAIESLASFNNQLARFRLDRARLSALAHEQEALAAGPDLVKREAALLAELKHIIADSEPLTRGTSSLSATQSQRLATEARRLLDHVRELDAASLGQQSALRKSLLAEQAAMQIEIANSAAAFAKHWEAPGRVASLAALKRDGFDRVVELLNRDKLVESLTALEQLAAALDKLEAECVAAAADRTDAKLAASQFAKWQADIRTRFLADPATAPAAEQRALIEVVERLRVPAEGEPKALREAILVHSRLALRRMELSDPAAQLAMRLSAEALDRLAQKTPALQDRHTRAKDEIEKLRREQDAIIGSTTLALRSFDKLVLTPAVMQNIAVKLEPLRIRQSRLADRAAALDVPRHEIRQARLVLAAKAAAADLKDGLPLDCIASLGACRRELDRLKLALEGGTPVDALAAALAAKQAEALRLALAAGENAPAKAWEPVVALQREVANGAALAEFAAPESPALVADARKAAELAERSLRDGSDFDTIVRRLRDAKESLALLADRLEDREPEQDRVLRLESMRRTAECSAKRLAGRMPDPKASGEAKVELEDEFAELAMTRVGAAAQVAKRKASDAYVRLMNKAEPDRQAADQKQLAESLVEIAKLMSGEARLATRPEVPLPAGDAAEDHLPSAKHAAVFRDLARQTREVRERLNGVGAVLAKKLTPAASSPFAAFEARQRAIEDSLLQSRDGSFWIQVLRAKAARAASRAADRLAVGDVTAVDESLQSLQRLGTPEHIANQTAIRDELSRLKVDSHGVAAQLQLRHRMLAEQAAELARRFKTSFEEGDSSLAEAENRVRNAGLALSEAARKDHTAAARLRADAAALLEAIPPPKLHSDAPAADPAALALREAERAMTRVLRDPKSGADAARRAAAALRRAADAPFHP